MSEPPVLCTICLDLPTRVVTTPCGHNFCQHCLSSWKSRSMKCPDCNGALPRQELRVNGALRDLLEGWAVANHYTRSEAPDTEERKQDSSLAVDASAHIPIVTTAPAPIPIAIQRIGGRQSSAVWSCANNHPLVVSGYRGGSYRAGWMCNQCASRGTGDRWFCRPCEMDICFACHPNTIVPVASAGRQMR